MLAIVGGGLAGASLAKTCLERNLDFDWYISNETGASMISSGIINPVSGRNYALAWRYDEFANYANSFYQLNDKSFIDPIVIKRKIYPSNQPEKQEARYIELKDYIKVDDERDYMWIYHAYQVHVPEFISHILDLMEGKKKNNLLKKVNLKQINPNALSIDQKTYSSIIFAEGIQVLDNPYFNELPFIPNRGQALIFDSKNLELDEILHDKKTLCTFKHHYWLGSSFERVDINEPLITEEMYEDLTHTLAKIAPHINIEHETQKGAFRSTTIDRRPILGAHHQYKNLYLFNGFGTKGASLIPFYANQLINHLIDSRPIDREVSIERFYFRVKSL